jgi:hypothetical protein
MYVPRRVIQSFALTLLFFKIYLHKINDISSPFRDFKNGAKSINSESLRAQAAVISQNIQIVHAQKIANVYLYFKHVNIYLLLGVS